MSACCTVNIHRALGVDLLIQFPNWESANAFAMMYIRTHPDEDGTFAVSSNLTAYGYLVTSTSSIQIFIFKGLGAPPIPDCESIYLDPMNAIRFP